MECFIILQDAASGVTRNGERLVTEAPVQGA